MSLHESIVLNTLFYYFELLESFCKYITFYFLLYEEIGNDIVKQFILDHYRNKRQSWNSVARFGWYLSLNIFHYVLLGTFDGIFFSPKKQRDTFFCGISCFPILNIFLVFEELPGSKT